MDWRKFFNTLVVTVVLAGLGYYRIPDELQGQQRTMVLLFAIIAIPPFAIWAILIFLNDRDLLPEWRWPWARRKFQGGTSKGSLDHLLTLCGGDTNQAERLIQFELKRQPGLKRSQAVQKAASRLEYDRSR